MNNIIYTFTGILFGIVLYKGEVISWFRIQEMFRFQSFYMYGVFACAIAVGVLSVYLVKRFNIKALNGELIQIPDKKINRGYVIGGILFGMGWALTGACPGPLYAHIGVGSLIMVVSILSAVMGTWVYSYLRSRLPH